MLLLSGDRKTRLVPGSFLRYGMSRDRMEGGVETMYMGASPPHCGCRDGSLQSRPLALALAWIPCTISSGAAEHDRELIVRRLTHWQLVETTASSIKSEGPCSSWSSSSSNSVEVWCWTQAFYPLFHIWHSLVLNMAFPLFQIWHSLCTSTYGPAFVLYMVLPLFPIWYLLCTSISSSVFVLLAI